MGWLEGVRRQHGKRKLRYALAMGVATLAYVAILVAFHVVFWVILDMRLPIVLIEHIVSGVGAITIGFMAAVGPKPVLGKEPPEHVAARAFLEGRDVRPDDNHMEDHRS